MKPIHKLKRVKFTTLGKSLCQDKLCFVQSPINNYRAKIDRVSTHTCHGERCVFCRFDRGESL